MSAIAGLRAEWRTAHDAPYLATGRLMSVKVGDYVASDDHEATMTVLQVVDDKALCQWLEDADIEGAVKDGWYAVKDLSVLQSK